MTATSQPVANTKSRWRRLLRRTLWTFVGPYLLLVALVGVFQRAIIYHPRVDHSLNQTRELKWEFEPEGVEFTAPDGTTIHGWWLRSDPANSPTTKRRRTPERTPIILYFCGNAGNRSYRGEQFQMLLQAGAEVVCFDYRGFGDNKGKPTEAALAQDARAAWNWLVTARQVEASRIVLFGESLGGGVAVGLAAELSAEGTTLGGLILRSTFSSLADAAAYHYPILPVRWMLIDQFPSIERIGKISAPLLVLHGDADRIVPFEQATRLFAAAPEKSATGIEKQFVRLAQADHNDVLSVAGPQMYTTIRDFLESISPESHPESTATTREEPAVIAELIRNLTYFPDRSSRLAPEDFGWQKHRVQSVSYQGTDGLVLNGWYCLAKGRSANTSTSFNRELAAGRPIVVFFSGNGGHRGYRTPEISLLTEIGADVLIFDYRGYGDNPGEPSEEGIAADVARLWQTLIAQWNISPSRMVLYGESLGGAVATRLASEICEQGEAPAGLVIRSSFSSLTEVARHHYPLLPVGLLLTEKYASVERIRRVTCPILILHGEKDTIVPFSQGETLFAAAPEKSKSGIVKQFAPLPLADHNDVIETARPAMETALSQFIKQMQFNE